MKKYFLYARKSSERDERQIQSIEDQLNYCRRYARDLNIEITKEYIEEKSARAPNKRKNFQEMMDAIEVGKADWIICWKVDRLSRNPVDAGTVQYALQRGKIEQIITADWSFCLDTSWLIFSVMSGMANQYIMDLSKNSKRGMQGKADRWGFPWQAPQGYLNDKIEKTIIQDPERWDMVRKMWTMLLSGCYTPPKILDIAINEWGYRTPKKRKTWGKPPCLAAMYKIFRNPFYTWHIRFKGKLMPWNHEAMITMREYEEAQEILRREMAGKSENVIQIHSERPSVKAFPFTGAIICKECWCMITAETHRKILAKTREFKEYTYYHCTHKKDSRTFRCSQRKNVSENRLEEQIEKLLLGLEIHPEFFEWARSTLKRRHSDEVATQQTILNNIDRTITENEKRLNTLLDLRIDGSVDKNEYLKRSLEINNEITSMKKQRSEVEYEADGWIDTVCKTLDFAAKACESFKNGDIEKKKEIFRALGSNWVLHNGELSIDVNSWFVPIQKFKKLNSGNLSRLELARKSTSLRKTGASNNQDWRWWRGVESNYRHKAFQASALPLSYPAAMCSRILWKSPIYANLFSKKDTREPVVKAFRAKQKKLPEKLDIKIKQIGFQ